MTGSLEPLVRLELARAGTRQVQAVVDDLLRRHGGSVAAILFYGSCRRDPDRSGLLDLYVLYDGHFAFHPGVVPAVLNAVLPPNVTLPALRQGDVLIRAKVAMLSRGQFARRMRPDCLDTTVWARFAQPASLVYVRDAGTERWVVSTLACGLATAALWAARLGPATDTPGSLWENLFARTFGAELRPERGDRPSMIYASASAWFDQALAAAMAHPENATRPGATRLRRTGQPQEWRWRSAWALRRLWGKPLNLLRLLKAAFTVENGADYIAGKIERHSGLRLTLNDWERRHPVLAAPVLLRRLSRLRAIRRAGPLPDTRQPTEPPEGSTPARPQEPPAPCRRQRSYRWPGRSG